MWVPESAGVVAAGAEAAGGAGGRPRRTASSAGHGGIASGEVAVPMQGTIIKVLVETGDTVEEGQTVAILEAMKMENAVVAEKSGTVSEVRVSPGDTVGGGDVVVVIA
jgi:acetyl-CoA/propionyl-CoA carboxylase biotin carboxyl carrier protein